MEFAWNEEKRLNNRAKHGLDFEDAGRIFGGEVFVVEDTRYDYAEQRFIAYGELAGRIVVLAFTLPDDDTIRIISMRKANKREQRAYDQERTGPH